MHVWEEQMNYYLENGELVPTPDLQPPLPQSVPADFPDRVETAFKEKALD